MIDRRKLAARPSRSFDLELRTSPSPLLFLASRASRYCAPAFPFASVLGRKKPPASSPRQFFARQTVNQCDSVWPVRETELHDTRRSRSWGLRIRSFFLEREEREREREREEKKNVSVACYDKLGPAIVTNPTYSRATPASRLHRLTPTRSIGTL